MSEYKPEDEEIDLDDIELHEGDPEFEDSPTSQTLHGSQDDEVGAPKGEALGDDLAEPKHKGEPNE